MSNAREIREKRGVSQVKAAVLSGTSVPTVRLYEAQPEAVRKDKRAGLDEFYERLERGEVA